MKNHTDERAPVYEEPTQQSHSGGKIKPNKKGFYIIIGVVLLLLISLIIKINQ